MGKRALKMNKEPPISQHRQAIGSHTNDLMKQANAQQRSQTLKKRNRDEKINEGFRYFNYVFNFFLIVLFILAAYGFWMYYTHGGFGDLN